MKPDEPQFGTMLHALQERAKELNCLYQVGELVGQSDRPIDEIFRDIIEVLPPGWQYPHECQARILFETSDCPGAGLQKHALGAKGEHCCAR